MLDASCEKRFRYAIDWLKGIELGVPILALKELEIVRIDAAVRRAALDLGAAEPDVRRSR